MVIKTNNTMSVKMFTVSLHMNNYFLIHDHIDIILNLEIFNGFSKYPRNKGKGHLIKIEEKIRRVDKVY